MVVKTPSGGGVLPVNPISRLSFNHMDQMDHDRLNRAQSNTYAKASYQRSDQYLNGVTVEKLESMKANLRTRKLAETKKEKVAEKVAAQEARNKEMGAETRVKAARLRGEGKGRRGGRGGVKSKPFKILGLGYNNVEEQDDHYDYPPSYTDHEQAVGYTRPQYIRSLLRRGR